MELVLHQHACVYSPPHPFTPRFPCTTSRKANILNPSAVEINVTIICSCMPSLAAYLRHRLQSIRSITSHVRTKYFRRVSSRKQSSSMRLEDPERGNLGSGDKVGLTLGSAIRNGKFMKSSRMWPLSSVDETGTATSRNQWEQKTLASVV